MTAPNPVRVMLVGKCVAVAVGLCGLFSLGLAVYGLGGGWREADGFEFFRGRISPMALGSVGMMGSFLAIFIWKSTMTRRIRENPPPEYQWASEEFCREIDETKDWPEGCPGGFWWRHVGVKFAEEPGRHVDELRALALKCPSNLPISHAFVLGLIAGGRWDEAKSEIIRMVRKPVSDGTATLLWWLLLENLALQADVKRFEATVRECLSILPQRGRPLVLDYSACHCFMRPSGQQLLELADRFSAEALLLAPQSLTVQGTRGSVLAELGRLDEAEALLGPVFETASPGINRAYSALYLAVICLRRGQTEKAKAFAQEAQRNEPAGFVIDRLKAEGL